MRSSLARNRRSWLGGLALIVAACQSTGVNPTGLTGGQIACQEGPRQTLDCRGALQQYARDFKLDLSTASAAGAQVGVGLGVASAKLTEADALSGDLIQHYYQACTLYNACLITREEYVAKTEKLQGIQLAVRRALVSGVYGSQQNIQIMPPMGGPPPPPGGGYPPQPYPPPPGGGFPPQGSTLGQQVPPQGSQTMPSSTGGITASVTPPQGSQDTLDSVLTILREGSKLIREQKPSPGPTSSLSGGGAPGSGGLALTQSQAMPEPMLQAMPQVQPQAAPQPMPQAQPVTVQEDLDASLRVMLVSLKQDVGRRSPTLASAPAVVGNFTEEGQAWSGPLGALLRDRVAALVTTEGLFASAQGIQTRGITIKQVAAVENPNDPKALGALYGSDLAITGVYRPGTDRVAVQLTALDAGGREVALTSKLISTRAIPAGVAALPANSASTSQLLGSLNRLGPKSQNGVKVEVTTNRPGAGASFRLGEEIRYFVTSTAEGYLYLFHMDADRNLLRIFPNQHQRETKISAGATLEVPAAAAPFKLEASPPFGLETTFAIVTPAPLDEKDFQVIERGFARPKQEVAALVASRGLTATGGEQTASPSTTAGPAPVVIWNAVTVLIRP